MMKLGVLRQVVIPGMSGVRAGVGYAIRVDDFGGYADKWLLFTECDINKNVPELVCDLEPNMVLGRLYRCSKRYNNSYICRIKSEDPETGAYSLRVIGISEAMLCRAAERAAKALQSDDLRQQLK